MPALLELNWNEILDSIEKAVPDNSKAQHTGWQLMEGYLKKFSSYDVNWKIHLVEPELYLWVDDQTLLLGRVDLVASMATGDNFFGEWKTANPKQKGKWQSRWTMSPQALTYGLLTSEGSVYQNPGYVLPPAIRKFHVRVAFKTTPPSFEYDWFTFTPQETAHWKSQVIEVAEAIRQHRMGTIPWMPNFSHCARYGPKYLCPFLGNNCGKLNWNNTSGFLRKVSHLDSERAIQTLLDENPNVDMQQLVVLDATRIEEFLNCREKFRQIFEVGLYNGDNDELLTGTAFHGALHSYYNQLKAMQELSHDKPKIA